MIKENDSGQPSADAQAAQDPENIRDRMNALNEKTSRLNETLDRVEKNLREAAGEK